MASVKKLYNLCMTTTTAKFRNEIILSVSILILIKLSIYHYSAFSRIARIENMLGHNPPGRNFV